MPLGQAYKEHWPRTNPGTREEEQSQLPELVHEKILARERLESLDRGSCIPGSWILDNLYPWIFPCYHMQLDINKPKHSIYIYINIQYIYGVKEPGQEKILAREKEETIPIPCYYMA